MPSIVTLGALRQLGVSYDDVAALPQITPQLRAISRTIRRAGQPRRKRGEPNENPVPYGPGADLTTAWPLYLAASDDPDIVKLLAARRSVPPSTARLLPIEAFCAASGVSPLRVIEVLVAAVVRQGAQASTIIAAVSHPRVVQKTVEMALTDDGTEDRATLHKAVNFLPTPKGNTTIINNTPMANASARAESHAQAAAVAPPPEQTIRRLSDRFNEARLHAAPTAIALPVVAGAVESAVDESRFADPPPRYAVPSAVPSRITAPAIADATPLEEEEDE